MRLSHSRQPRPQDLEPALHLASADLGHAPSQPVHPLASFVPTADSGQAVGALLYFPLLFFAGVHIPLEVMPGGIWTLSKHPPSGATVPALSDGRAGAMPETSTLVVLVAYIAALGWLATRLFRRD